MEHPKNFWSVSITDAFFHRLCAAGTFHRQAHNTYEKKLGFLAGRIGLTESQFLEINPLNYEKTSMWGWSVPLTPEERLSIIEKN